MLKHKVTLEAIAGEKSYLLLCDHDSPLPHCLEAIKAFELYILDRIRQAEQQTEVKVSEQEVEVQV